VLAARSGNLGVARCESHPFCPFRGPTRGGHLNITMSSQETFVAPNTMAWGSCGRGFARSIDSALLAGDSVDDGITDRHLGMVSCGGVWDYVPQVARGVCRVSAKPSKRYEPDSTSLSRPVLTTRISSKDAPRAGVGLDFCPSLSEVPGTLGSRARSWTEAAASPSHSDMYSNPSPHLWPLSRHATIRAQEGGVRWPRTRERPSALVRLSCRLRPLPSSDEIGRRPSFTRWA
jgi:hypothetical protein